MSVRDRKASDVRESRDVSGQSPPRHQWLAEDGGVPVLVLEAAFDDEGVRRPEQLVIDEVFDQILRVKGVDEGRFVEEAQNVVKLDLLPSQMERVLFVRVGQPDLSFGQLGRHLTDLRNELWVQFLQQLPVPEVIQVFGCPLLILRG